MGVVKWTDEKLAKEAKKYQTRGEFQKGSASAYNSARRRGEHKLNFICAHMKSKYVYWSKEALQKEAEKYKSRGEFQKKNSSAYQAAKRRGHDFLDKICSHMCAIRKTWDNSELESLAKKFKTIAEFSRKNNSAYVAAVRRGLIGVFCAHMTPLHETWGFEKLKTVAKEFKTRGEFQLANHNAYTAARSHGVLDEICSHMEEGVSGFKRTYGGFLYQFRVVRGRKVYYKVGISNHDPLIRAMQFGVKDGVYIERTHAIWFEDGAMCRQMEKELHAAAKAEGLQYVGKDLMKNGFTEIFTKPLLQ